LIKKKKKKIFKDYYGHDDTENRKIKKIILMILNASKKNQETFRISKQAIVFKILISFLW